MKKISFQKGIKKVLLAVVFSFIFHASFANATGLFWVGGTGTWDASDTSHWALTTGGVATGPVPGSGDTVTFDGSSGGGTVTLGYNPTVTSITMGAFTGTFNASTFSPTMTTFSNSGTGTRTLTMGSGTWTITGNNATIFNCQTVTNLTVSATTATINLSYSGSTGTRVIVGCGNRRLGNFTISAGTDTLAINTNLLQAVGFDFTGFAGTWSGTQNLNITGNFKMSSGMTVSYTGPLTLVAGSGTTTITSNGKTMASAITLTTGTWQLADAFSTSSTFSLSGGSFDLNGKSMQTTTFSLASGTKSLIFGSGTWTVTGTGTVWDAATNGNNFTVTANTGTIKINDTTNTAITFSGNGKTYPNIYFNRGASTATNTIVGSNTFTDFKDDGSVAHTDAFTAGTTTTVNTLTVSGTAGNVITLNSTSGGTGWTLSAPSGVISRDYLSLQDSKALGGANFYAGTHSTNTSGNTGWQFFAPNLVNNSAFFVTF